MSIYSFTHKELYAKCHSLYTYNNGQLLSKRTGMPVGHWPSGKDYLITTFVMHPKRFKVLVHRLIFLMHHGYLPENVDHINGNKTDNRIENLRAATATQNKYNRGATCRNTSGYKNLSQTAAGTWQVIVSRKYVGTFSTIDEAVKARDAAQAKLHGEFACA